ncbi:type IV pilus assembly protein PilY1 [Paucimonas lemoignei]|uniref:Type IV pilus assembly protein PilY1 n=1 Tax=Paucimonas lemoignei TaxID=29443 RepID=A0A4R3HRG2_PAULE|nr:PilC/PilY family type IV pilus protein [Paucimonas lemoignei]TCS35706.1 type IV pilus assembly protein PilY1 [Paucimonas lemoignei]
MRPSLYLHCILARRRRCICFPLILAFGISQGVHAAVPIIHIASEPLLHDAHGMSGATLGTDKGSPGRTFLYQSGFDAATWSGKLIKLPVTMTSDRGVQLGSAPEWDAAEILTGKKNETPLPLSVNRQIYTANADTRSGITEFKWEKLAEVQRTKLDVSRLGGATDGLGPRRLGFLRGEREDELGQANGIFRPRDRVLGDIVNSNPVFVGAPASVSGGADYRSFYEAHKSRANAVYVGANDGMLHAFDASSGIEFFAYLPDALLEKVSQLAQPEYHHQNYVDGAIAVAEAQVRGGWKTVLVAGMGGGAQGVFALDVSTPEDFKSGIGALWEFTDRDDGDIGNVFNVPVIARFKARQTAEGLEYRYFAMVGSGVNNYLEDGHADPLAPAVLFLLALDKKPEERWQLGINYFKFKKPILDTGLPNGLSSPGLVLGEDGAVRFAYAGDLQGNLWRFDFTGFLPWSKENSGKTPLFTAQDSSARRQPITVQPRVVFAPGSGYVVLFGTGKFMEEADTKPAAFSVQSFYGIYDTTQKSYKVSGRNQLEPRRLVKEGDALQITGQEFLYGESAEQQRGWYFDFLASDESGERNVSNPVVDSGRLIFNSLIPCAAPCSHGGGRSYVLNALSGLSPGDKNSGMLSHIGMLAAPLTLQTAMAAGSRNVFGKSTVRRRSVVINAGSGGTKGNTAAVQEDAEGSMPEVTLPAMRLSWREIVNWPELRLKALRK